MVRLDHFSSILFGNMIDFCTIFYQGLNDRSFMLRSKVEGEWCIGYDKHSERMWLNLQPCSSHLAVLWNMNEFGTIHTAGSSNLCIHRDENDCFSGDTRLFVSSCDNYNETSGHRWRFDSTGSIYGGGSFCAVHLLQAEAGGNIVMRPKIDSLRQQWYFN